MFGLALALGLGVSLRGPVPARNWLPAFIAPLHAPVNGDATHSDAVLRFDNVSLRQFIPLALPGNVVRLRFSNEFGDAPLHIGEVRVAWRDGSIGSTIVPGSDRQVLFAGQSSARILAGEGVWSDPVALAPGPQADLAVSTYFPVATPRASIHLVGSRSSYLSIGRHVAEGRFPAGRVDRHMRFLSSVEVDAAPGASVWVAFGDSITDGAWHSVDEDGSYPAQWGRRWRHSAPSEPPVAVLNAGIGGNRLSSSSESRSGLDRFDRDVLSLPGVRGVVILIGINDLGTSPPDADPRRLAEQVIAGQQELIAHARARGVKAVGATLTPVGGSAYFRPSVERARQQVNAWVRSGDAFDTWVDFDRVVRDPQNAASIRSEWTDDRLHPNDAGYRAMAEAVVRTLEQARGAATRTTP